MKRELCIYKQHGKQYLQDFHQYLRGRGLSYDDCTLCSQKGKGTKHVIACLEKQAEYLQMRVESKRLARTELTHSPAQSSGAVQPLTAVSVQTSVVDLVNLQTSMLSNALQMQELSLRVSLTNQKAVAEERLREMLGDSQRAIADK